MCLAVASLPPRSHSLQDISSWERNRHNLRTHSTQEVGTHFWGHPRGEQRVGTHWHWVTSVSTVKKQKGRKIPWKTRIFPEKYCLSLGESSWKLQ